MQYGGKDKSVLPDDRGQACINHIAKMGPNHRSVRKVGADELDTMVDRCRMDGHVGRFAGMNTGAGTMGRFFQRSLVRM